MADAQPSPTPPRLNHPAQSSSSIPSIPSPQLPVLPVPPPLDIPATRPYTAATMASARTSFTHVDLDAPSPVPPLPGAAEELREQQQEASREFDLPQCSLTFLLVSGRRRTMSFEPETTIGRVKELVWNAWPSEWQDERPPSPSYLRILYLGKILQDDDTLAKLSFPTTTSAPNNVSLSPTNTTPTPPSTIVHLSIRPYAPSSEEDNLKKSRRRTWASLGRRTTGTGGGGGGTEGDEGSMEEGVEGRHGGCCSGCVIS